MQGCHIMRSRCACLGMHPRSFLLCRRAQRYATARGYAKQGLLAMQLLGVPGLAKPRQHRCRCLPQ